MGAMEIISLIGLILSIATGAVQGLGTLNGVSNANEWLSLAKDIAKKIGNNSALLTQLQKAYNAKNSDIANSILRGMGFGPRMENLQKQAERNDDQYYSRMDKINKENTKLEAEYNKAVNLSNPRLGFSGLLTNAPGARTSVMDKVINNIDQNIKGGTL